jgi:hypothetical protein
MSKIQHKMYLHSDDEANTEEWIELFKKGLVSTDRCPDGFRGALYEVEFDVEVDTITGDTEILKVDGRELKDE